MKNPMTAPGVLARLRRWARGAWPPSEEPRPFERGHRCARLELLRELEKIEAEHGREELAP
jgi:hypothetical protein